MAKAGRKRGRKTSEEEEEEEEGPGAVAEDEGRAVEAGRGRAKKRLLVQDSTEVEDDDDAVPSGNEPGKSRLGCKQVRKVVEDKGRVKSVKWLCAGCGGEFATKREERKHAYRTNLWLRKHAPAHAGGEPDAQEEGRESGAGAEGPGMPAEPAEAAADASGSEGEEGAGERPAGERARKPKRGRRGGAGHARKVPCRDWEKGRCLKEAKCRYLHGAPGEGGGLGEKGTKEEREGSALGARVKRAGGASPARSKEGGALGGRPRQAKSANVEPHSEVHSGHDPGKQITSKSKSKARKGKMKGHLAEPSTSPGPASVGELRDTGPTGEEADAGPGSPGSKLRKGKKKKKSAGSGGGLKDEKPLVIPKFI